MKHAKYALLILVLLFSHVCQAQSPDPALYYDGDFYGGVAPTWSGIPTFKSTCIEFDGPDSVWIAGDWGLSRWEDIKAGMEYTDEEQSEGWTHYYMQDLPISGETINVMLFDQRGLLWIGTIEEDYWYYEPDPDGALWMFDPKANTWEKVFNHRVYELVEDHSANSKIYGVADTCLICIDPAQSNLPQCFSIADSSRLRQLCIDPRNNLWIADEVLSPWTGYDDNFPYGRLFKWDVNQQKVVWSRLCYDLHEVIYDLFRECIWSIGLHAEAYDFNGNVVQTPILPYNGTTRMARAKIDQYGTIWLFDDNVGRVHWWNGKTHEAYCPTDGSFVYSNNNFIDMEVRPNTGKLWMTGQYNLRIYTFPESITAVESQPASAPETFTLSQNWPNPFNASTNISFTLPRAETVTLTVYNTRGQQVAEIMANQHLCAGTHTATFNATNLPTGIYLFRLEAGGKVEVRKGLYTK